ncbi:phospholipase A [Roseateles sp.]|jgi:phospholipase A1|uniref:phospholipase A n=1 Tax=Roseateles sp. TaxID=1971397 RepID=UPI00391A8F5A
MSKRPALLSLVLLISPAIQAQEPGASAAPDTGALQACAAIGAPADRLACYDRVLGRAPEAPLSAAPATATSLLAPKGEPLPAAAPLREEAATEPASLLARYWELEPGSKRGVFNLVGYRASYVMPLHITSRINRAPNSPTQAPVPQPSYRHEEAKFQISLRTKLAQDFLLPGGDLWAAYTQQAMWQIFDGKASKPFRNTDYEPELIYVLPAPQGLRRLPLNWQWRYALLSLTHQSNGQSDPLSRSWNRVNLAAGFERGPWSLIARMSQRIKEPYGEDNNPDLVDYRGRHELQLNWAQGRHTLQLLYRSNLRDLSKHGALQLEWTYPVYADQPNGLRWYVQAFRGSGETLTDYNFRQSSLGAGLSFLQF